MRESSGDGLQEHPCWAGLKSFPFVNNMDGWLAWIACCHVSLICLVACNVLLLKFSFQVSHGWLAWVVASCQHGLHSVADAAENFILHLQVFFQRQLCAAPRAGECRNKFSATT